MFDINLPLEVPSAAGTRTGTRGALIAALVLDGYRARALFALVANSMRGGCSPFDKIGVVLQSAEKLPILRRMARPSSGRLWKTAPRVATWKVQRHILVLLMKCGGVLDNQPRHRPQIAGHPAFRRSVERCRISPLPRLVRPASSAHDVWPDSAANAVEQGRCPRRHRWWHAATDVKSTS
jgi:hypothetical protein